MPQQILQIQSIFVDFHHLTREYCIRVTLYWNILFCWLIILELNGMVWQGLMGWSRKNAGWREGAIENNESFPAVCQGRRFLELLLMWSQLWCQPGEMNVIYNRNHLLIIRQTKVFTSNSRIKWRQRVQEIRWLLLSINYTSWQRMVTGLNPNAGLRNKQLQESTVYLKAGVRKKSVQ